MGLTTEGVKQDSVDHISKSHQSGNIPTSEPDLEPQEKEALQRNVGLANPASVHCEKLGGKLVIQNTENGQIGMCHLPDGRIIEEWELFRSDHKAK